MGFSWSDNPVTSRTPIRKVHISELRAAVDQLRADCSLPAYTWTDNPVTASTPIRAVHFTELRAAIQDVWTCHGMGSLPNWTYGSAPAGGRPISARDVNDLRAWVDQVDPPGALNGLHWQSPVTMDSAGSRTQVNAGAGFGSVLILSPESATGAWDPSTDPSATQIYWLERNRTCNPAVPFWETCVVRLLLHAGAQLPAAKIWPKRVGV